MKVATLIILTVATICACSEAKDRPKATPAPEIIKALSPFQLTDQHGHNVALSDYQGHVWVANFIFTKCPSVCPRVTASMRSLHQVLQTLNSKAQLVTFSVDPLTDTPAVLLAYAQASDAEHEGWRFLTAPSVAEMVAVVEGNFQTAMGERPAAPANMYDIAHSTKLVLVDRKGRIRGYFPSEAPGHKALLAALKHLETEP